MYSEIKDHYLRVPLLLHDLRELAAPEKALSYLTALHKITSSDQEALEYLYRSNGMQIIMSLLEIYNSLTNLCLKILINISKKHEKARKQLVNNNVFRLLALKLGKETDFSKSDLILYSALIVVLVQDNNEAQNLMRTSGCLLSLVHMLSCILDESKCQPLPNKNAELIICAIIASSKDPRYPENQAEVGRITPKVLEYLGKQPLFSDAHQLEVVKCLWLFLKYALNQNETNQRIFLNHSGLSVLFRSIQDVVDEGKCEELGHLLAKITGVLIKLKSHPHFLLAASNYCPLMILGSLLKTGNKLVIQQSITFLNSLTKNVPQTLQIIKETEIPEEIKKVKTLFHKNQIAAEFCEDLLNRMEMSGTTTATQNDYNLHKLKRNFSSCDVKWELELLRNHFCVVHDVTLSNASQNNSNSLFDSFESDEALENTGKSRKPSISSSPEIMRFSRKTFKNKEKNLKKVVRAIFSDAPMKRTKGFNIRSLLSDKINKIFQKCCSFFTGLPN